MRNSGATFAYGAQGGCAAHERRRPVVALSSHEGPITSEILAKAIHTHPVVVRRIMAGLRDKGFVRSEKGHNGGWMLACDLAKVSLRDIYEALGCPALLAIGNRSEAPDCLVEQAVNSALGGAFDEAEALLLSRLGNVTLAELSADFHARLSRSPAPSRQDHDHVIC
jgi:DNA-binding IscR family transcriptional regulator